MELFREEKKAPIKLRGFKFSGWNKTYPNACYYFKELPRDNFEIMECMIEGIKKPELGAGTSVKIIDSFMATYLEYRKLNTKDIVKVTINNTFKDFEDKIKKEMISKFTSKIPDSIKANDDYIKYTKDGFKLLYCSNDETPDRLFGIVNIVLVKEVHIESQDKRIDIKSDYTVFKPFKFRVSPAYLNKKSKQKYLEENIPEIVVNHEILV